MIAEIEKLPHHIAINADEIARQVKSPRSSNMVVLGAASPFIDIPYQSLENGIRKIFERKGREESAAKHRDALLKPEREFSEANKA
ncbi:MAG: 2-oxoacid:acceptor oxidoreductase family protein [Ignavibacteriales bacterium]|nr:2-oxoacid:acceptor oxidoreductase family protein [Ignavibacteriales bacterium]